MKQVADGKCKLSKRKGPEARGRNRFVVSTSRNGQGCDSFTGFLLVGEAEWGVPALLDVGVRLVGDHYRH